MKSVVITKPFEVEIVEAEIPKPREGEALLRTLYGGICGSDLTIYRGGNYYASYPLVPGHEFSCEIVEVGKNDRGLSPGMIVTANPYFHCGICYACRRGHLNCCHSMKTYGVMRDGAFREYHAMPVERVYDGRGLSPRRLAEIEPFCIGWHAVKRGGVTRGDNVFIVGAGTIGVMAMKSAKLAGASVTVCDVSEKKLELAKALGADHTVLNSGGDVIQRAVDELTGGDGFDVTMEAVGLPSTFLDCLNAAAYRARVVLVGVAKTPVEFNQTLLQTKELDVFGSRNALQADFTELLDLTAGGACDGFLDAMVTKVFPAREAPEAFAYFHEHAGENLKIMLDYTV